MILSDREIGAAIRQGMLTIEPVPEEHLWTSTAVDLTLDATLVRWKAEGPAVRPGMPGFNVRRLLEDPERAERVPISADGYELRPGQFVLGYTSQAIHLPRASRLAARVEGKSSLARLGVGVHVTAPTIQAGFGDNPEDRGAHGLPIQLEIFNLGNLTVTLDVGMSICQLILEEVREVPVKGYAGQFAGQKSFTEFRP